MANVNNYIRAAQAVAQDNVNIFSALDDNSPQYDRLAKANIQESAKTKARYARNEAEAAIARIRAERDLEVTKKNVKTDKEIRGIDKQARMTGKLAGGAAMLGVGAMLLNKKEEEDPTLAALEAQMKKVDDRINSTNSEIDRLTALGKTLDPENIDYSSSSTSDNTSSSTNKDSSSNNTSSFTNKDSSSNNTSNSKNSNLAWSKLSDIIRYGEGTLGDQGYNTQFTGSIFKDTSKHPRQLKSGGGYTSDAAGAYQFLSTTWDRAKKALGLTDFSPASQEAAGRYLTQQRGVDPDRNIETLEEFKSVMDKLAPEWASLPYSGKSPTGYGNGSSYYGQGGKSLEELWERYQNFGL